MRMRTQRDQRGWWSANRGMILAIAYLMLSVMTVLQVIYLSRVTTDFKASEQAAHQMKALHYAEAGLDQALYTMQNDAAYPGTNGPVPLGNGSYSIDVVGHPSMPNTLIVGVMGGYPGLTTSPTAQTRRIEALVRVGSTSFNMAVFGDEGITIASTLYMGGFDSRDGVPGGANDGLQADIGTNGTAAGDIMLGGFISSNATAYCGAGTTPVGGCANFGPESSGGIGKDNLSAPVAVPPVTPPTPPGGYIVQDLIRTSGTYTIVPTDPLIFPVPGGPPAHYAMILNNLSVTGSAKVNVSTLIERLSVYVLDDVTIHGESVRVGDAVEMNAERFLIYATGTGNLVSRVTVGGYAKLYGAIYASAMCVDIKPPGHLEIKGAIAARCIATPYGSAGLRMYFDYRLLDLSGSAAGDMGVLNWSVN